LAGTTRITRNIFAGSHDRTQNAMLFLENLSKIKQASTQKHFMSKQAYLFRKLEGRDRDGMLSQASYPTQLDGDQASLMSGVGRRDEFNSDTGFESLDPVYEDMNSGDDDEVLLNISPNKFEKPKDQLYMDFFVKYTELFVKEKQTGEDNSHTRGRASATAEQKKNVRSASGSQKMRLCATSST